MADATNFLEALRLPPKPYCRRTNANICRGLALLLSLPTVIPARSAEPQSVSDHLCAATVLRLKGKAQAALAEVNLVISKQPKLAPALITRSTIYQDLQKYVEAIKDLDTLIALTPDDAGNYENKANCLVHLNRNTEAIACYKQANKLNPSSLHPLEALAVCYRTLNDNANALHRLPPATLWKLTHYSVCRCLSGPDPSHRLRRTTGSLVYSRAQRRYGEPELAALSESAINTHLPAV